MSRIGAGPGEQTRLRVPRASLLKGQGRRVASPWGELAVFLRDDGCPKALLNRCPHRGGSLAEGIVCGDHVYCTQHDWKICLSDGKAAAPDEGATAVLRAYLEGSDVVVEGPV